MAVRRDRGGLSVTRLEGIALAFLDRAFDDPLVDRVGERPTQDRGVVLRDWVHRVDHDLDRRSLARAEGGLGVLRRDDHEVDLARAHPSLRDCSIRDHVVDVDGRTGQSLILGRVRRQGTRLGHHDHGLERPPDAVEAGPEDRHDQERAEDQADDRARAADGLDELLADECEQPKDDGQDGPHQAACSGATRSLIHA